MKYVTPLRYPGGKSRLANFMKVVFRLNDLSGGHYVELYAGGASVAFQLLLSGYASHIYINDLDKSVYAFWYSVLNDTENLCRRIKDTPVTIRSWDRQRAIQERYDQFSKLELGFSTFFLNRTNRSGIITGGVIGGKKQGGDWLLDARYNKPDLIARIENLAQHKDQISLYNQDAVELINELIPHLPEKSLVYLDPPYYSKRYRLYKNEYEHDDHVKVAAAVAQMKRKWIVSYDNTPQIRKMYEGFRKSSYKLSYSANERYQGSEVIFFSGTLVLPAIKNPTQIKSIDVRQGVLDL